MSEYTLHWEIDDGYVGKSRPHTTDFDSDWVMDQEDWDKLSDDEKKQVKRQLNPNHAFHSDLSSVAQTYSFTEQTIEQHWADYPLIFLLRIYIEHF